MRLGTTREPETKFVKRWQEMSIESVISEWQKWEEVFLGAMNVQNVKVVP